VIGVQHRVDLDAKIAGCLSSEGWGFFITSFFLLERDSLVSFEKRRRQKWKAGFLLILQNLFQLQLKLR